MTTELGYLEDGVSLLRVSDVSLIDLDDVDAWLGAIGMEAAERPLACRGILAEGSYAVSNIENRVTLEFRQ